MLNEDFYEELERKTKPVWAEYIAARDKVAKVPYYHNTNLVGIEELQQFVNDCNKSFHMLYHLTDIRPDFDSETQETLISLADTLSEAPLLVNEMFLDIEKHGSQDQVFKLTDFVY